MHMTSKQHPSVSILFSLQNQIHILHFPICIIKNWYPNISFGIVQLQGLSEADLGPVIGSFPNKRAGEFFPNFQLKKFPKRILDGNPNYRLVETYDKMGMREAFLSKGKQCGSLLNNFGFSVHTACVTFAL